MVLFSKGSDKAIEQEESEQQEVSSKKNNNGSSLKEEKEDYFENAKLIMDVINNNLFLNSNKLFENLVKNYKLARKIYGLGFIKRLTGYDDKFISKNIKYPEFQKELKKRIDEKIEELKRNDLIDKEGNIKDRGYELASVVLVLEEIEGLVKKEGVFKSKKRFDYGIIEDFKVFRNEAYRDIALRKTIRTAIKRLHKEIKKQDLRSVIRKNKSRVNIILAIDASGSMKGDKLEQAKKAGVALSYKAIRDKNNVGLIIFREKVIDAIPLTNNFEVLAKALVGVRARQQTNLAETITKGIELLSTKRTGSKHLFIITDAIPTKTSNNKDPVEETLKAASLASTNKIRISIIGIQLKDDAEVLARKITELTSGVLYRVKTPKNLDVLLLEEYDRIQ